MLLSLGKADVERRSFLRAGYSAAVSASVLNTGRTGSPVPDSLVAAGTRHVGRADVTAVHDVIALFSRIDQRHGGGHGRSAEHAAAQRYFVAATKLATEADDAPLTGHILRAMAHQAIDLGDPRSGLALAEASVDGSRYRGACPRERALLTVVHAKALSAAGRPRESAKALLRAERDLAAACGSDAEPARVFFFSEASLAHETACALRDSGDLDGAAAQFQLSARKRQADMFTRTHAVTLGYLGTVQARSGDLDLACATWSSALDAMGGVRSGRTRTVARDIRAVLEPHRDIPYMRAIDDRAAQCLAASTA
ncbi:Uncharacterised protein [Nocardia farcinica]|uniref:Tat pathway signal protein n=1 Tax=Nocardia farcinica TaxID=37329 RepID=A0A449GGL2_NOCFR|nr:Uncharacterised protein [Nocardia farcinica]